MPEIFESEAPFSDLGVSSFEGSVRGLECALRISRSLDVVRQADSETMMENLFEILRRADVSFWARGPISLPSPCSAFWANARVNFNASHLYSDDKLSEGSDSWLDHDMPSRAMQLIVSGCDARALAFT